MKKRIIIAVAFLMTMYVACALVYSATEGNSFGDSLWWAFMTFTTVGYGDQYPHTIVGRIAGISLVFTAVFIVVPCITATIASMFIVDNDAFTHEEQEEVKYLLREINKKLEDIK
jgi:voltage-gated potassium channel